MIKVHLLDSVNCYIEGLTWPQKEYIIEKTKLPVAGAHMSAAYKIGQWDGKESLFNQDGTTFIYMLADVFACLEELNVDIDNIRIDDEREDFVSIPEFETIPENLLIDETGFNLRPHQVNAIQAAMDELCGVIEAATSSGKSAITLGISKLVDPYIKTLILVPSNYLADQTFEYYEKSILSAVKLGSVKPNKRAEAIENHRHIVCTYKMLQTSRELFEGVVMGILADECYHPSHMILSRTGWKYIKDVVVGEEVMAYDAETMTSRFEPVSRVIEKKFSGELCHLYARNRVDLLVTPNHEQPVWTYPEKKYKRIKMKDFKNGLMIPVYHENHEGLVEVMDEEPTSFMYDGNVHCVTVPSGNLITKRDTSDVISISGNCHVFGEVTAEIFREELRNCPMRIGLTGTLPPDKQKRQKILAHLGGEPLIKVSAKEMTDKKIVSKASIEMITTSHPYMVEMSDSGLWDWEAEFNYFISHDERLDAIAKYIHSLPETNTLILCHAQAGDILGKYFGDRMIRDETPDALRKQWFGEFDESNEAYYLCASFQTSGTGVSINNIQRVVLLDIGKTETTILQCIGRGMRLDGKTNEVDIIDISADTKYASRHRKERIKLYKREKFEYNESDNRIKIYGEEEYNE